MKVKRKDIEFRISRRILWVDAQAYPLGGITRVERKEYKPNRARMFGWYGREAGACLMVAVVGLGIIACLGDSVPPSVSVVFALLVFAALTFYTVKLVRGLLIPNLFQLSIATAGSQHTALMSTDKSLIDELIGRIAEAIDNPAMEYSIRVDNLEITQGNKYGGDHVEGDKTENKV